jgi:hypothetical protein
VLIRLHPYYLQVFLLRCARNLLSLLYASHVWKFAIICTQESQADLEAKVAAKDGERCL